MENIILTNNKDLRLVSVKVGVLSTLRFELPLVSASATRVEVIVTSGDVHSAYTATFISDTKRWQCDIAASQFPAVGKQSYEVAYMLDGKQFWDGKGWIEIEDATTSGIEPQPRPEPYRYAVVSVNGYGADAQGAVRIPKTFTATNSPTTTEGFMEGDIYFNRETGATWTLCDVQGTLTWVLNKGVMTVDPTVTRNSQNPVSGGGVWSAIWGALASLPTGISSLYDWCVAQLAGKATKADVDPLLFAQYYPDGSVKSAAEFTQGIKYDAPDTTNRTITVRPFCDADDDSEDDNSNLSGRVVIPPFVDAQRNPHISDDGTRYRVVGVSGCNSLADISFRLTVIVAPNTVTSIGNNAFVRCTSLTSVSLPAATSIRSSVFSGCTSLASVDFGDTPRSSVPSLGLSAFYDVPASCTIIVPYTQYDEWIAADGWKDLPQEFVRHAEKSDRPTTFTTGNLAALDASGNPTDSLIPAAGVALKSAIPYSLGTPIVIDTASSEVVEGETVYYGAATLANRTANIIQVTAATALDELRITFPAATSGKVRDFGLRVEIGTGSAALTAPALVPIAPTDETIKIENNAKEIPALADGTATAKGVTLLYFSETAPGVFVVKGEQVEEVA